MSAGERSARHRKLIKDLLNLFLKTRTGLPRFREVEKRAHAGKTRGALLLLPCALPPGSHLHPPSHTCHLDCIDLPCLVCSVRSSLL